MSPIAPTTTCRDGRRAHGIELRWLGFRRFYVDSSTDVIVARREQRKSPVIKSFFIFVLRRWFKTPGSGAPLVAGNNNNVIVCDAAEREKLIAARREALEAMNRPKELNPPNGGFNDSGNSPGSVQ
jgi:hypothetical protein